MDHERASGKQQGFKNQVENVAIVGAGGRVGKYVVEELVKTGKHRVTAITRIDSANKVPARALIKRVNYDDIDSLVEVLRGQQVLIIAMAMTAPPEQHIKLIEAAAAANVPFVLPNEWGIDNTNEQLSKDMGLYEESAQIRAHIEKLGKSSWIGIACSFWYEFSLSFGAEAYGFDLKNRTVTFIDDGTIRINTSTWRRCGRAVAGLLSLRILPDDENDKSPHLAQFRNSFVRISSFLVSQKDMLDSVMRVTGTKLDDWKIGHEPSKERYEAGVAEMQNGDRMGLAKMMYTRIFYPDGSGDYETPKGLHNGILGLPEEDLDEYTKIAVQMAEEEI